MLQKTVHLNLMILKIGKKAWLPRSGDTDEGKEIVWRTTAKKGNGILSEERKGHFKFENFSKPRSNRKIHFHSSSLRMKICRYGGDGSGTDDDVAYPMDVPGFLKQIKS